MAEEVVRMTTIAAFLHGYPPFWSMGGEVSTHRTLRHIPGSIVFTDTDTEYEIDGVRVMPLPGTSADEIRDAAESVKADVLFAHSTLSVETVRAGRRSGIPTVLAVHAPPRFAADLRRAWSAATVRLYNTWEARRAWSDHRGWVLHPPAGHPWTEDISGSGNALTLTSSLMNKGAEKVLKLAAMWPSRRFIIVESPAHLTHGRPQFFEEAATIPNVEIWPRLHPDKMGELWAETRVLLVPSRYETYGMSAVEAAWHGIPSAHVDTPHVREGIGPAARLLGKHSVEELAQAVQEIETNYLSWSRSAKVRVDEIWSREQQELDRFAENIAGLRKPVQTARRGSRRA